MIVGVPYRTRIPTFGDNIVTQAIDKLSGGAITNTTDEIKALKVKLAIGIVGVAIAGLACVVSAWRGR